MAAPNFNSERAAMILAEASLSNDTEVAERWGVSKRTIARYRARLAEDAELSLLVTLKTQMFCRSWVDDAAGVIKVAASEVKRRMRTATNEDDAKVIHAIAGAAKIFGELNITYTALQEAPANEFVPDREGQPA
ncbi:MAG: helix-turn-helix domain-containing protein [Cyanobacteria bacterium J06554_11]